MLSTVAVAQLVESRIVIPVVVGSNPISHPTICPIIYPIIDPTIYLTDHSLLIPLLPQKCSLPRVLRAASIRPQ